MKIYIDPGHGGSDPGAVGPSGLKEKDVNLSIATKVKEILEKYNIDAILTRQDDRKLDLYDRVKMANSNRANYFVSVHINSASNPGATGAETFAFPNSQEGTRLAYSVQNALVNEIKLPNRGVKHKDFYVLKNTAMPAVLAEVAFINNPKEEKSLKEENFLYRAALGICKGILEFLGMEYKEEDIVDDGLSPWAKEAMKWAKELGLTDGTMAKEPVSLERLITILHRYHNLPD